MPSVSALITAEDAGHLLPNTLIGIRRAWPLPPRTFAVYVEILNPEEQPFDLDLEVWRGKKLVYSVGSELFPGGSPHFDWVVLLEIEPLQAKTHTLIARLNGDTAAIVTLDVGKSEER